MIHSFGDQGTEDLYNGLPSSKAKKLAAIARVACRKLDMIDAAAELSDLKAPPGNRLEALKGNLAGYHSIRINDQWRIVFKWTDGSAHEVSIVDYH